MKDHEVDKDIIIVSASSDIGYAMCMRYLEKGWRVFGTYRTRSDNVEELESAGVTVYQCDLAEKDSIRAFVEQIKDVCHAWDALVLCPGTQNPVGRFLSCDFDEWEESICVNFTRQVYIVKELLSNKRALSPGDIEPCVLFFAGCGTNNATINYSAYTLSKIALIKSCELLDAEIEDVRFSIVGPGWVKTKIHQETLLAGEKAEDNFEKTKQMLECDQCTSMDDVLDSCDWVIQSPRNIVGGRNFSTVFDKWGTEDLCRALLEEPNMYKLRRFGNEKLVQNQPEEGDAEEKVFDSIIPAIIHCSEHHRPGDTVYEFLKTSLRKEVERNFHAPTPRPIRFGPFGNLVFPYHKLGNTLDSLNLFDLDEVITFAFYWCNRERYTKVLDLGANIGLHSIILDRCGYDVTCYEPDPFHFDILSNNIQLNQCLNVKTFNMAVSTENGTVQFTRVMGNTMSSHISGAKKSPYGDLEYFDVETVSFQELLAGVDFVKMDVEAHEKNLLMMTNAGDWEGLDAMVSIHDQENAAAIFEHFKKIDVNIFSQLIGWQRVEALEDMPCDHHGGSIFVSKKRTMTWL